MSGKASPFHRGEKEIQLRLGVGDRIEQLGRRMIQPGMPDRHQRYFSQLPFLFVGTADAAGRGHLRWLDRRGSCNQSVPIACVCKRGRFMVIP